MLQQIFHYGANEMTLFITNQMNKTIETSYDILIGGVFLSYYFVKL
jgi:hypothetical protein